MARINASGQVDNQLGLLSILQVKTVTLSAAQLIAMFTTPVTILPAPPPNTYYAVLDIIFQMKPGTTQFTGGGAVTLVYAGGSINPHASNIPAATVNSATGTNNVLPPITGVIQPPAGTGINITNATAAFATGNGTATVHVHFHAVTVA